MLGAMDVKGPLVAFEIDIDAIPEPKSSPTARPAMNTSDLLPVKRDFAFVVDADVPADKLMRAARGAEKALVSDVSVFDVFEGGNLGEGKRSLAHRGHASTQGQDPDRRGNRCGVEGNHCRRHQRQPGLP